MALGHYFGGALTISVVTALGLCEKRSLDLLKLGTLKETQPRGEINTYRLATACASKHRSKNMSL